MSNYNSADPTMPKRNVPKRGTVVLIPENWENDQETRGNLIKRLISKLGGKTITVGGEEEQDFGTGGKLVMLRRGENTKHLIGEDNE